jgi:pre-mRNA-processing factor 19
LLFVVSGEVPQDPVVSKFTGHLYERRLIEKYIEEEGKCPVSGAELTTSDLLPITGINIFQNIFRIHQVYPYHSFPQLIRQFDLDWSPPVASPAYFQ